ncbi:two-component system, OmpR family, sensor histidine kinase KdpD [Arthrobacter sp. OV608]|nr:two-component system, OmpR family, sensor histidine kinase KdpD [Arthrobacter sp. OV608]
MWLMAMERIVVGLQGDDDGELLVRRAARLLHRGVGGELLAVHVRTPAGTRAESPQALEAQRRLVADVGGSYHTVSASDAAAALVEFARSAAASHILVGQSRRRRITAPFSLGVDTKVVREAADIDVQVVPLVRYSGGRGRRPELGRARTGFGFALAAVLPPLLQLLLAMFDHSVATAVLIQLTGAVAVALVGGLWPAVSGALWSSLLVNYFSTPPLGDLAIHDPQDLLSLAVFVGVSVAVAGVVDGSARRSKEASRAQAEAATLGDLALGASRSEDTLHGLLAEALDAFGASGAAVVSNLPAAGHRDPKGQGTGRTPLLLAGAGDISGWQDGARDLRGLPGATTVQVDPVTWLVLFGREVPPAGRRLLGAFAVHVKAQLERRQLESSRHEILRLAEGNTMRTAILQAVSHDLRTPLAGIKLAAGGLLQNGVAYTPAEQRELLETIDACSDRLDSLVGNLLDMSRITARSVEPLLGPVRWSEAIDAALRGLPDGAVAVALPANLPPVEADRGLLERVIANILENALKHAPGSGVSVTTTADGLGGVTPEGHPCGELRIVDHGPGVPERKVLDMFRPFQRVDDLPQASGLGLGLAVAQGFVQAMRGTLSAEGTPGGGLTMIIRLPLSTGSPGGAGSIAANADIVPGSGTVLT